MSLDFQTTTLSRVTLILYLIVVLIHLINAIIIEPLKERAQVSHSGPTNFINNNDLLNDNINNKSSFYNKEKRAAYFGPRRYEFNNAVQNNNWRSLLLSAEAPNEYLKLWILSQHNRYRQMVNFV